MREDVNAKKVPTVIILLKKGKGFMFGHLPMIRIANNYFTGACRHGEIQLCSRGARGTPKGTDIFLLVIIIASPKCTY